MNFDLCDHWVIYDPLRSEKTVIAIDRINTVLSYGHIDISFQEISEKSVEPVLMIFKGLRHKRHLKHGQRTVDARLTHIKGLLNARLTHV